MLNFKSGKSFVSNKEKNKKLLKTTTNKRKRSGLELKKKLESSSDGPSTTFKAKKKKGNNSHSPNFKTAMTIFKKYCPGLGHDGDGLYGTLTNNSLHDIMTEIQPKGKTLVDIGAADGKVLLAGLAFQANFTLGIELAGDALEIKFNAMINGIKKKTNSVFPTSEQVASLKCCTDITSFNSGNISELLITCFPRSFRMKPGKHIVICAVWHGFTITAKQSLLKRLAKSHFVKSFTLVGPQLKDYGKPDEVLEYMKKQNPRCTVYKVSSLPVKLSGGGEQYQAITFAY